jgi:AraC family transcriptional activator of pobA
MNIHHQPAMFISTCLQEFIEVGEAIAISTTFKLVFICRGTAEFYLDGKAYWLREGSIIWVLPGSTLRMEPNGEAQGYCIDLGTSLQQAIQFAPELIYGSHFMQHLLKSGSLLFDHEAALEASRMIEKMREVMAGAQLFQRGILERYLKIFFFDLFRQFSSTSEQQSLVNHPDVVQRFLELLEKNFATKKSVADYAALLFLSPNYLNTIIKKVTGFPASHHIKQRIALEAKRLGAYTDLCMKQVAYGLGFDDIPHFSKYFKSATGMNFTDFKQEKYLLAS